MENLEENSLKMIGANVPATFAMKFTSYCRKHRFNQRQLFENLTKMWLEQDRLTQEHIYHGRVVQVFRVDDDIIRAQSVVARTKVQSIKQKQKRNRKSAKPG
jgi:hypothetical protein